jgi:hypothetical protein
MRLTIYVMVNGILDSQQRHGIEMMSPLDP